MAENIIICSSSPLVIRVFIDCVIKCYDVKIKNFNAISKFDFHSGIRDSKTYIGSLKQDPLADNRMFH
ncbi:MAG: hypothetical protein WKF36_07105 [Candidatus Nitrosocosmicus sp.]